VNLAVTGIWLDKACKINFSLKNQGKGGLSQGEHKRVRIKLSRGKHKKGYYLGKIDRKGALAKPGGGFSYNTGLVLKGNSSVKVQLGKVPRENQTKDNQKTQLLIPKCLVRTEISKPGGGKPGGDSSQAEAKEEVKPLLSPSAGAAPRTSSLIPDKAAPSLALSDLYLEGRRIHVVMQNQGKGRVTAPMAVKGRLKLNSSSHQRTWSLLQLDPTRSRLNRKKGVLDFDTGLDLQKSELVKAELVNLPGKDQMKKKRLTPKLSKPGPAKLGKAGQGQKAETGKSGAGSAKASLGKASKIRPTLAGPKPPAGLKPPEGPKPLASSASSPLSRARGSVLGSRLPIEFRNPRENAFFAPGASIEVNYRVVVPTDEGDVTLELVSAEHGVVATTTHRYVPVDISGETIEIIDPDPVGTGLIGEGDSAPDASWNSLTWPLPGGLPHVRDYYIRAYKGGLMGRSADFAIGEQDLELVDVFNSESGLSASVRAHGMPFRGRVQFRIWCGAWPAVRDFYRELDIPADHAMDVAFDMLPDLGPLSCGVSATVELDPSNAILESNEGNNRLADTVYLHENHLQFEGRVTVYRPDTGYVARAYYGSRVNWADLGIGERDEDRTVSLAVTVHLKNCGYRYMERARSMYITASGRWPCGGGSLGTCDQEARHDAGEVYLNLEAGQSMTMELSGLRPRAVPLEVEIHVDGFWGPANPYRFTIDFY
jgi:hypothetical protein